MSAYITTRIGVTQTKWCYLYCIYLVVLESLHHRVHKTPQFPSCQICQPLHLSASLPQLQQEIKYGDMSIQALGYNRGGPTVLMYQFITLNAQTHNPSTMVTDSPQIKLNRATTCMFIMVIQSMRSLSDKWLSSQWPSSTKHKNSFSF